MCWLSRFRCACVPLRRLSSGMLSANASVGAEDVGTCCGSRALVCTVAIDGRHHLGMFHTDVSATANPVSVTTASAAIKQKKATKREKPIRFCSHCSILSTTGVSAIAQLKRMGRSSCCRASRPAIRVRNAPSCPPLNGVTPAMSGAWGRLPPPQAAGQAHKSDEHHHCMLQYRPYDM